LGKQADLTFEQAIRRLEEIVESLDGGELPLNDALGLFEEGVKLAGMCSAQLEEAQTRLKMLTKTDVGNATTEPLDI
jgi:exodeoxyribonuclease VII small subunit